MLAPASLEAGGRVGDQEEAGAPLLLNPTCVLMFLWLHLAETAGKVASSRTAWFLREFLGWIKPLSLLALLLQLLHRCCPQSGAAHPPS